MTTQVRFPSGERAATRRPAPTRDDGFTFVELLIAIVLMGTVVIGILAATQTLVAASRTSREAAKVETALLAAAEQLERAPRDTYKCEDQLYKPVFAAAELKLGLTAAEVPNYVRLGYHHLEGDDWVEGACVLTESGVTFQPNLVQRITITLISPDNGLERTLEVIKGDV
jgi:type II secretory pathway pseudopilin PulG